MPEILQTEPLPKRPAVIVIYGDPAVGKTSLGNTCETPYVLDFDRGVSRSIMRKDTLLPDNWKEVLAVEGRGRFNDFKTIVIDTAKALLDDYLMVHVTETDRLNQKNKQRAFGAIGDEFKFFVNKQRAASRDLLIIAHSKEKEDGDIIKRIPDVTGGSYAVLLRIADQVGYVTIRDGKRIIIWEPGEYNVGKNVARLSETIIPDEKEPELKTFMAAIFEKVKTAIVLKSEAEVEANLKADNLVKEAEKAGTIEDVSVIISVTQELPRHLHAEIFAAIYSRGINIVEKCETPEELTSFVTLYNSKPLSISGNTDLLAAIDKRKTALGLTYDKQAKKFTK